MGLFKKIADYSGVTHGVDPTGHNHSSLRIGGGYFGISEDTQLGIASIEADIESQSGSISFEITPDNVVELTKLLAGNKADKTHNHTNDSWLTTLLAGKADVEHTHTLEDIEDFDGREITSGGENEPAYVRAYTIIVGSLKRMVKAFCDRFILSIRGEEDVVISSTNLPNLVRALAVPDSTPTADSDNLVTSGGVAAALAGKAAASHTQAISTITGLQTALDGKTNVGEVVTPAGLTASLEHYQLKEDDNLQTEDKTIVGAINEVRATHATVIEVDAGDGLELSDQTPFGQMYHIDNSTLAAQLDQIITTQEGGSNIHYHQGAGEMIADHFMIRVYRYDSEYFVEIAGAWDNIVPPQ